jgi:hypothetical protein
MNQYGLNNQKETQAPMDFGSALYGGGGDNSFGQALLGNAGGRTAMPRSSGTGWEQDYSQAAVPTFSADASLASINSLLQGV